MSKKFSKNVEQQRNSSGEIKFESDREMNIQKVLLFVRLRKEEPSGRRLC